MAVADVDVARIRLERLHTPTFDSAAAALRHPERMIRRIAFACTPSLTDIGLVRTVDRFPFVPDDVARLDSDCYDAFNIQVQGLVKRLQSTRGKKS